MVQRRRCLTHPLRAVGLLLTAVSLSVAMTVSMCVAGVLRPAAAAPIPTSSIYIDPYTWASWALGAYRSSASSVSVIAGTPQSRWFTESDSTSRVAASVNDYVSRAAGHGQIPVLTLYAVPHRDCGGYSAGGFTDAKAYAAWIAQVRRGIAKRTVAVVLEPDALANLNCLPSKQRTERYAILKQAVYSLTADASTYLYIDAGHSHWHLSTTIANRLKAVGVSRARGFSLNVSNFYTTREQINYGEKVSKLLGGKRYVIDTSRNGLGPASGSLNWCNPAGRALGTKPTLNTAGAHADAYLWIKHPGESDGTCGRHEPKSGTWWNSYAVGLVERSIYRR